TLAREHDFPLYTALGAVVQNCAALQRGKLQAGLATMTKALSAYRATGARLFLPLYLACLAEGYLQVGKIQNGLQVVKEALHLIASNLDRFWEAELYRLKGELSLQSGQVADKSKTSHNKSRHVRSLRSVVPHTQPLTPSLHEEAEGCFQKAMEVAR